MKQANDIITSITSKTGDQIQKKFQYIHFCGIGGSMNSDGSVDFEKLAFQVNRKMSKDEALVLMIEVIETCIKNIYYENKLNDYLTKYPFTVENLEIVFFIKDEENNDLYHPNLGRVTLNEEHIYYKTLGRNSEGTLVTITCESEPYEEAIKKIK